MMMAFLKNLKQSNQISKSLKNKAKSKKMSLKSSRMSLNKTKQRQIKKIALLMRLKSPKTRKMNWIKKWLKKKKIQKSKKIIIPHLPKPKTDDLSKKSICRWRNNQKMLNNLTCTRNRYHTLNSNDISKKFIREQTKERNSVCLIRLALWSFSNKRRHLQVIFRMKSDLVRQCFCWRSRRRHGISLSLLFLWSRSFWTFHKAWRISLNLETSTEQGMHALQMENSSSVAPRDKKLAKYSSLVSLQIKNMNAQPLSRLKSKMFWLHALLARALSHLKASTSKIKQLSSQRSTDCILLPHHHQIQILLLQLILRIPLNPLNQQVIPKEVEDCKKLVFLSNNSTTNLGLKISTQIGSHSYLLPTVKDTRAVIYHFWKNRFSFKNLAQIRNSWSFHSALTRRNSCSQLRTQKSREVRCNIWLQFLILFIWALSSCLCFGWKKVYSNLNLIIRQNK